MEENIEQITQDPEYATHADLESLKTEITEEYTAAIEDAIDDAVDKGDMKYVTEAELRMWKAGKLDCENAISAINTTINNIMQTIGTADGTGSIFE